MDKGTFDWMQRMEQNQLWIMTALNKLLPEEKKEPKKGIDQKPTPTE